jgi:hypothetical protein
MMNWLSRERTITALGAAALLGVLAVAAGIAMMSAGDDPLRRRAVLFVASVSGFAALSGWFVSRWSRGKGPAAAMAGGVGATVMRLAPMLAALGWWSAQEGGVQAGGNAGLLVAFYLPLLAADILLTLLTGPRGPWNRGANAAN